MGGGLRVIRNAGKHRHVQGFGDLTSPVRLSLSDDNQTQMTPMGRGESLMIAESWKVDPSAHDRSESRLNDHQGQCAALQQCGWRSRRRKATAVDDHINIHLAQPVESLRQVFPHSTEMRCAAGFCESGQGEPATLALSRQWQRLIQNRLPKWTTITVRLGDP